MNLHLSASNAYRQLKPNGWDVVAFPLILCLIALFVTGFHQTLQPIASLKTEVISLDPIMLPEYALRTTLRMLVAMLAALLFTLVYGTLAARSRRAEKSSSRCSISCNPCRYWVISLLP
jgi:NitT/TauT family transport system permease protein